MSSSNDPSVAAFAEPFTLLDDQAAALADIPRARLDSFTNAGHLSVFIHGARRLYRPADIESLRDALRARSGHGDVSLRRFAKALEYLQEYLSEHPPTGDYDKALSTGSSLLAKNRGGIYHAHIRSDAIKRWAAARGMDVEVHMVPLMLDKHLQSMGAVRLRGLRGSDGGAQRWEYWWRLPLAVWSLKDDTSEAERLRELVAGSARTPEERVRLARGGEAYVDIPPLGGPSS